MTAPRRRLPTLLDLLVLAAVAVGLVACGSAPTPSIRPSASVAPSLTPVPGAPSAAPSAGGPSQPPTSQAEGFGEIWDALPASWPALPGQSQSEVGSDATERFVVRGDPQVLARQIGRALEQRGWTVDIGSPLEDGSVVLDATGAPAGCKVQAQFFPPSPGDDLGTLLVYYGARCPLA